MKTKTILIFVLVFIISSSFVYSVTRPSQPDPRVVRVEADRLLEQKKYSEAAEKYRQYLARPENANDLEARFNLLRSYIEQGDFDNARNEAEIVRKEVEQREGQRDLTSIEETYLATALYTQGQVDLEYARAHIDEPEIGLGYARDAIENFDLATLYAGNTEYGRLIQARSHYAMGSTYLEEGRVYMSQGNRESAALMFEAARGSFENDLEMRPDTDNANFGIAESYLIYGDYSSALPRYEQFLERFPDDPDLNRRIGDCYANLNKPEEASAHYAVVIEQTERYIKAFPGQRTRLEQNQIAALIGGGEAERQLAIQAQQQGDTESANQHIREAQRRFEGVLDIDEGHAQASYELGKIYYLHGIGPYGHWADLGSARELFETALEREPNNLEYVNAYGMTLYKQEEYEKAAEQFQRVGELVTTDSAKRDAINNYALARTRMGDIEGAAQAYAQAADISVELGDLDKAERGYRNSISLLPAAEAYDAMGRLGEVYMEQDKLNEAKETYERMVTTDDNNPAGFIGLAEANRALGNYQDARDNLQQASNLLDYQRHELTQQIETATGAEKTRLQGLLAEVEEHLETTNLDIADIEKRLAEKPEEREEVEVEEEEPEVEEKEEVPELTEVTNEIRNLISQGKADEAFDTLAELDPAVANSIFRTLSDKEKEAIRQAREVSEITDEIKDLIAEGKAEEATIRLTEYVLFGTMSAEEYLSILDSLDENEIAKMNAAIDKLKEEGKPETPDPNRGLRVTTQNLGNIQKGTRLRLADGTNITIDNVLGQGTGATIVYVDPKTNTRVAVSLQDLMNKGAMFLTREAAVGRPQAVEGKMNIPGVEKPLDILKVGSTEWNQLIQQMQRDGRIDLTNISNIGFSRDSQGNVYIQMPGQTQGTHSNYIALPDGTYQYAPNIGDETWNQLSSGFQNRYTNIRNNTRYDPTTGQLYTRRNNRSRWTQSADPTLVIPGIGDAEHAYNYELDGVFPNMIQRREKMGQPYTYYYYDPKTRQWVNLNDAVGMLREALENRFGEEWADKYAKEDMNASQILNNVNARLSSQRFWGTFFEGSPTLLYQTVEDKLTTTWGWDDYIQEHGWLEDTFWKPELWETAVCNGSFEDEIPESVQVGYTEYGPVMTMRLEATKQAFPDMTTLYTVSWLVSPIEGEINYTLCYNKCNTCIPVQNTTIVEAPEVDSGFNVEYIPSIFAIDYVSICYHREVDDQVVEVGEFERPIITVG